MERREKGVDSSVLAVVQGKLMEGKHPFEIPAIGTFRNVLLLEIPYNFCVKARKQMFW